MRRDIQFDRQYRILRLLAGSPGARSIAGDRTRIESALRAKPRRVWPLATVARLFGISPSLLRKWTGQGFLSMFRRPTEHHRPGLTERAVRKFLAELAAEAESGTEYFLHRPRRAEEKCRKANANWKPGEALAPAEFAARAGVSVTTVRRLLAAGDLDAWHPTPHRPKICDRWEKERRNRLTKKKAKKGR